MRHYDLLPLEGAHPEISLLAGALRDATRDWRAELGDAAAETMIWQPFPGGHSIGALILHIADVEAYWIETAAAGKRRPAGEAKKLMAHEIKQYKVQWPTPPLEPLSWYFELHDGIRRRTLETLLALEDPDGVVEYPRMGYSVTVRWIVNHVVAHEAYHGGQAVLLRTLWERRGSMAASS